MPIEPILVQPGPPETTGFHGSVCSPGDLSQADRDQMYDLLSEHFLDVHRSHFERDLDEKEYVVLVREPNAGAICGFSTLLLLRTFIDGEPVTAVYSGDTIVDQSARGQAELHRVWGRHVWQLPQAVDSGPFYWFMVSCGYKTYRFFPLFFHSFYPNCQRPTPAPIKHRLDVLARMKFGDQYDGDSGIVRFPDATPLRPGVADLTPQRLQDPHVAFYVASNPGHIHGHGLACLAEITRENLSPAALRMLRS